MFRRFGFHFHHGLMMLDHKHKFLIRLDPDWLLPEISLTYVIVCERVKILGLKRIGLRNKSTSAMFGPSSKLLTRMRRVR